jgi:hypothetical protein
MTRFASLALVIAFTGTAYAETHAERATRLNDEGKDLMVHDQFADAAKKFQEAVAEVPEAKYYANLCTALLQIGKLDEALSACNKVEINSPTPEQKARAEKLIALINEEAKKQKLTLHPPPEGGCSGPDCTPSTGDTAAPPPPGDPSHGQQPPPLYSPTVGRPLENNLVAAGPPDHSYTWTLGVDVFGGGGQIGQANAFGTTMGGVRVKGDFLLNRAKRFGGEVYFQYTHLGRGEDDDILASTLDIFDIGFAGYKHFCPGGTPRLCFTPLVGVHLALMSPAGEMDETGSQVFNYAAVGGRAEGSMDVAFGRRYEHVLSISVGANLYSQVLSGPSANNPDGSFTAAELGLDKGGAMGYLGLGYTYRFNTPLGRAPFVILE